MAAPKKELDRYEIAVNKWVAQKARRDDWTKVSNVEFDMGSDGYCETCYSEYVTISYKYDGKFDDLGSIRWDDPASMIREISALVE